MSEYLWIKNNCFYDVNMLYIRDELHNNLSGFVCLGDFILSEYENQFCALSAQLRQKFESWSLFNTNITTSLLVGDFILV